MAFIASLDDDDDKAGNDSNDSGIEAVGVLHGDNDDDDDGNDSDDSGIEAVGVSHAGPPRFRPQHNGRLGRRLCCTFSCALPS